MNRKVFVSYASSDRVIVDQLCLDLDRVGADIWLDQREMRAGQSLVPTLAEAIKSSGYVLAIISRNSVNSRWMDYELRLAVTSEVEHGSPVVVPVRIDGTNVPQFLSDKVWVDYGKDADHPSALSQILRSVGIERFDATSLARRLRFSRNDQDVLFDRLSRLMNEYEGARQSIQSEMPPPGHSGSFAEVHRAACPEDAVAAWSPDGRLIGVRGAEGGETTVLDGTTFAPVNTGNDAAVWLPSSHIEPFSWHRNGSRETFLGLMPSVLTGEHADYRFWLDRLPELLHDPFYGPEHSEPQFSWSPDFSTVVRLHRGWYDIFDVRSAAQLATVPFVIDTETSIEDGVDDTVDIDGILAGYRSSRLLVYGHDGYSGDAFVHIHQIDHMAGQEIFNHILDWYRRQGRYADTDELSYYDEEAGEIRDKPSFTSLSEYDGFWAGSMSWNRDLSVAVSLEADSHGNIPAACYRPSDRANVSIDAEGRVTVAGLTAVPVGDSVVSVSLAPDGRMVLVEQSRFDDQAVLRAFAPAPGG